MCSILRRDIRSTLPWRRWPNFMLKSRLLSQQPECPNPASSTNWTHWIDIAVFTCLAVIAICAPLATKGATNAFRAATAVWLIKILTGRVRFYRQPLALLLFSFLILSFVSTLFSFDPFLSWGRMRTVTLLFIAVLLPQTLNSMRRIKILTGLLVGACCLSVLFT